MPSLFDIIRGRYTEDKEMSYKVKIILWGGQNYRFQVTVEKQLSEDKCAIMLI